MGEAGKTEGGHKGRQRREEMRSYLRKNAATRLARARFQWPIADPGYHLASGGEL